MDLGWNSVLQAVILAACTWYIRNGNKHDSETVVRQTAAQSTSNEILERTKALEVEMAVVKRALAKEIKESIDHRGPARR